MEDAFYRADLIQSVFGDGVLTTKDRPLALTSALLSHVPFADVEPVRHGAWCQCFEDWRQQQEGNKCSVCGFEYYGTGGRTFHYCPSCGAKMDLEG